MGHGRETKIRIYFKLGLSPDLEFHTRFKLIIIIVDMRRSQVIHTYMARSQRSTLPVRCHSALVTNLINFIDQTMDEEDNDLVMSHARHWFTW